MSQGQDNQEMIKSLCMEVLLFLVGVHHVTTKNQIPMTQRWTYTISLYLKIRTQTSGAMHQCLRTIASGTSSTTRTSHNGLVLVLWCRAPAPTNCRRRHVLYRGWDTHCSINVRHDTILVTRLPRCHVPNPLYAPLNFYMEE